MTVTVLREVIPVLLYMAGGFATWVLWDNIKQLWDMRK